MSANLRERLDIDAIVNGVVAKLKPHAPAPPRPATSAPAPAAPGPDGPVLPLGDGVFATVDEAVRAATAAQKELMKLEMDKRDAFIRRIKEICEERCDELAKLEMDETRIGRLDHKVEKLKLVKRVLGVEVMRTDALTDTTGATLISNAPFGVLGMVTPATHSVPTMAGNAINAIAAGNAAVFSPHPAAAQCLAYAMKLFNREFNRIAGIRNLLCTMQKPSIPAAEEIFHHKGIPMLCITGGPMVVKAAMKSGKRVVAAGPGNPPVVVDETACLTQASKDIIAGASFDNNLLCIGEKEVFVVRQVADAFIAAMKKAGAVQLNADQVERLTQKALLVSKKPGGHVYARKEFIGKDASVLAEAVGVSVPKGTDLLFGETRADHPFVMAEQMMPFLPVARAADIGEAIEMAVRAEHGFQHTAIIHSRNLDNVTRMARRLDTTLFVQNGACAAALGLGGPGYLSYSIATPTGEGVTTPLTFTRQRQLVIGRTLNYL